MKSESAAVDNVKRKPAGSEWKVDSTLRGEGGSEPLEGHEEGSGKRSWPEKSAAGTKSPRSPAARAEKTEGPKKDVASQFGCPSQAHHI